MEKTNFAPGNGGEGGGGVGMGSGISPPFLYDPELQKKIVIELVQNLFLSRRLLFEYGMKD